MPLWKPEPVDQQPEVILRNWIIYEIQGTRHFVGYNEFDRSGRVSSPIMSFDPIQLKGVTRSGRVYSLIGESRYNADADYVWLHWCRINGFDHKTAKIVEDFNET